MKNPAIEKRPAAARLPEGPSPAARSRAGQEGAGTVGSILTLLLGGGAVMVVLMLFLTGLAQKEILPRIQRRAERAVAAATRKAAPQQEAAAATSSDSLRQAGADSLEALRAQIETQKRLLQRRKEDLNRMRTGIDSLLAAYRTGQDKEIGRQAKVIGAMRPEEAAQVLEVMDDHTVSALLQRMDTRAAGKILAKLDALRAARLTMASIGPLEIRDAVAALQSTKAPDQATQ